MEESKNSKLINMATVAVFLVVLGYLLYCAAPNLYWGDSAEMTAVSCDLGVAHSPGYPLYSMVSRAFSWLPLDPYPFRINVMSSLLTALAASLFFRLAVVLAGGSLFAGLIAVAGIMGCREFVEYGLYAEVYPLHMVLLAAVLLAAVSYRAGGKWTYIAAALFLAGVGTAHHFMMLTALAALLLYMLILPGHAWRVAAGPPILLLGWAAVAMFRAHDTALETIWYVAAGLGVLGLAYVIYVAVLLMKKKLPKGAIPAALGALLAPAAALLIFGFIPLASARGPASDWWSPETTTGFLDLILLQGYASTFPAGPAEWLQRLNLMEILFQVPVLILLIGIPGLIYLFRLRTREAFLIVLVAVGTFVASMFVTHGKPDALRLPMYAMMYVSAGVGAVALAGWRVFSGAAWRYVLKWICVAAVIAAAGLNLTDSDWRFMNRSGAAYDFGRRLIEDVRAESILFLGEQSPGILGYFESCEPEELAQKNLKVIPVSFLLFDWKIDQLRDKYHEMLFPDPPESMAGKPVFRADDPARAHYAAKLLYSNKSIDGVYSDFQFMGEDLGWRTVPSGVVYQLVPVDTSEEWMTEMMHLDNPPDWGDVSFRDTTTAANLASVHNERGKVYLERASRQNDESAVRKALEEFDRALEIVNESLERYAAALKIEKTAIDSVSDVLGRDKKPAEDEVAPPVPAMSELLGEGSEESEEDETGAEAMRIFYGQVRELLDVKAEATSNKGQCRVFYGQPVEGLRLMASAVRMSPLNPRLYEALATMYFRGGAPEKAVALWSMVISLDAGNARAYHNIGSALVGMQQRDAAVGYYSKALEIDPLYKSAYINLGRLHNKMKNCPSAILTLEEAKENYRDDLGVRSELAQQYGDCAMKHLFANEVESLMADFSPDSELFYTLAIIFRRGMQVKNMAESIRKLKEVDPDFPVRRLFASMEDCNRVIKLLDGIIEELPDELDLQLELSLRHGLCGDEEKAIGIMENIVRQNPDNEGAKMLLERFKSPDDIPPPSGFPMAPLDQ